MDSRISTSYLKPILTIDKSLYTSTELNRLYYQIYSKLMTPGDVVLIRNCRYHSIELGLYLGLDHNELFTLGEGFKLDDQTREQFRIKYQDNESNIKEAATVHRKWDGTDTAEIDPYLYFFNNSLYKILQYPPGTIGRVVHPEGAETWEFEPMISPLNTTIVDIVQMKHKVMSKDLTEMMLEWMGCLDLHSCITPNGLMSDTIESDNLVRVIGFTPETSNIIPNGDSGKFPVDLIESLIDNLSILDDKLDNLVLEESNSKIGREVVEYGDISDYISIKTLVEVSEVEHYPTSLTSKTKSKYTIKYKTEDMSVDPVEVDETGEIKGWDNSENKDTDHKIYMFHAEIHKSIERLIKIGALLELNILYKLTDGVRNHITWNPEFHNPALGKTKVKAVNMPSGIEYPDGDPDPYAYYTRFSNNLHKISFEKFDLENPDATPTVHDLRMDGYHITFGDPEEYLYSELILIQDSFIRLNDDFIIQITNDGIILYPQNNLIQEYYIKSCKIIYPDDN